MRLRRFLYIIVALFLVLVKFTIDVIGKNVELEIGGVSVMRELIIIGAAVLLYLTVEAAVFPRQQSPIRKLGFLLIAMIAMIVLSVVLGFTSVDGFDVKNLSLLPLSYPTLFIASFLSLLFGLFAVIIVRFLRELILYRRKKGTQRNFTILAVLIIATSGSTIMMKPMDSSVLISILFALTVVFAIVNSFRLPWIVYLTKREKIFSLVYGFFLFIGFTLLNVLLGQNLLIYRSVLYYSYPLKEFISLVMIFGNIYFGMAFVSTLFHLPTAEAFDRKRSEVTSLHNLSKLVTQVFDFNELVDTVTSMTLQVCEAQSCWLEIIHAPDESLMAQPEESVKVYVPSQYHIQVAGMKNISRDEIETLVSTSTRGLRDTLLEQRRTIVVDDVMNDQRFTHVKKGIGVKIGSLVVVPLVSHVGLVGILYATKQTPYGFVQDDVDVISAFADQATVAIENSRLIKKSIERERLLREMLLAQEMQKKLLPQGVPEFPTLELDAASTPAFEVGGDYYDFMQLNDHMVGIIVGDVSGKGVSAAFYMSEVKGIFQALSKMYTSPKEFMVKANAALAGSIDKHSFVSLIYAIVDVKTGELTLSRAGHCPLLLVSGDHVQYIRPNGMGLGLNDGPLFEEAIEEHTLQLLPGDVCVFYTDGLTEARRGEEEFGYERLLDAARHARAKGAEGIKDEILGTVKTFIEHQANDDDQTLVVLKWRGDGNTSRGDIL